MKHQIKNRYTGDVLFECELPADTPSGLAMRHTLEKAIQNKSYLQGADLRGANLQGANLQYGKLIGERPFFQIGPIGSRHDYFTAWITDQGLKLQAGCFFGTVEEFTAKLSTTHADNDHAKEYQMGLMMIEAHAAIWTPKEQSK